jgi:Lipase (class 3)
MAAHVQPMRFPFTTITIHWWWENFGRLLVVTVGLITICNADQPIADNVPILNETVALAHLSRLVYQFRYSIGTNCTSFNQRPKGGTPFAHSVCHWYYHDNDLGTQVLIVTNEPKQYVAVVFAGTDDLRTSLEDANVLTMPFGDNNAVHLPEKPDMDTAGVRVHAGFNHAVFLDNIWDRVYQKTKQILEMNPDFRLFSTGHSLGAANSILTAISFGSLGYPCLSINFGAPQTGNYLWRLYFNNTSPLREKVGIWRVVLAWDVVARLPELFYHVGHTIQLDGSDPTQVRAYYQHYGDEGLGFAGVPFGWSSKSYAFLPWALGYHHIKKYVDHLDYLEKLEKDVGDSHWPMEFFPVSSTVDDDDCYDNPPDDFFVADSEINFGREDDDDEISSILLEEAEDEAKIIERPVSVVPPEVVSTNQLRRRHAFR